MADRYPEVPAERRARYEEIFRSKSFRDESPEHVVAYYDYVARVGINQVSPLNRDQFGSFLAPYGRDGADADIAIVGLALEMNSPTLSGTRFGPQEIRRASKEQIGSVAADGTAPFAMCRIIDYGDVDPAGVEKCDFAPAVEYLEEQLRPLLVDHGVVPLCFGGEHTATYAPLKLLAERYGPLGLVHVDQHLDAGTAVDFPHYPVGDATLFGLAFAEGIVDPERTITIGAGGRSNQFMSAGRLYGQTVFTADEVFDLGMPAVAEKALQVVGQGPTYFSFDVDALCPSECSSGGCPDGFGMTWRQVYDLIRILSAPKRVQLVGADIMEFTPRYPTSRRDGLMAAMAGWELLCWLSRVTAGRNGEWRATRWQPMLADRESPFVKA